MGKYPVTNITYSGLEDKGGPTVTILDENKNKWTIWKADYEFKEQDSEAYASLQSYKIGETFGVEYQEKEDSFTPKDGPNAGKTIKFTRRTIYKILPLVNSPTSIPAKSPSQAKTSNVGHPGASETFSEAFWEKKAYKQCLWGYWLEAVRKCPPGELPLLLKQDMKHVWITFKAIEADADKRFSPVSEPTATDAPSAPESVPVIHADEDMNVEGIPF